MTTRKWYLPALASLVFGVLGCSERKVDNRDIEFIGLTQLRVLMDEARGNPDKLLLIDPRIASEFAAGHLPGAVNIRLPEVDRAAGRDPMIARHSHIVVYGNDPGSAVAQGMTKKLISRRYKNVRMFAGGIAEWRKAGFALEQSAPEPGG
ncbi:MAG: rhodanese-like domain-containing protein [Planctomycetota bacterium]|nr:MAG: rhodanese-like domain-containing protein [Planctomycetota bacterium]